MWANTGRRRRRLLNAVIATSASGAALLGVGATPALASYKAQVQGGTLQITGNGASDKLALHLDPNNPNVLQLDVGEDGTADFSFDRSTFDSINVDAGGGNDDVRVDDSFGSFATQPVTIDGGSGDDTLTGGDGNDTLIGGAGNDTINGGRGADVAELGSGADTFIWNPGDGSDTVDGQSGNDTMLFNGSNASENFDISANGSRVRLFRDVANITMDLGGIENLALNTLGGADKVNVNDLTGTDLKQASIDNSATGGGGDGAADTVIANGTPNADDVHVGSDAGTVNVSGLTPQIHVFGRLKPTTTPSESTPWVATTRSPTASASRALPRSRSTVARARTPSTTPGPVPPTRSGSRTTERRSRSSRPVPRLRRRPRSRTSTCSGRRGDDTITGGNGIAGLTNLTIRGGGGDDAMTGGDGNDTLIGGGGNDTINGGRGTDVAELGSGADTFIWNPGDGSDTVDGQSATTRCCSTAQTRPRTSTSRPTARESGCSVTSPTSPMDLGGIENLALNTLGAADDVTVNDLSGTDLKHADINLSASTGGGDGAADTVIANGTPNADKVNVSAEAGNVNVSGLAPQIQVSGSEAANDTLQVNTLGGKDAVSVAPDVSQLINPVRRPRRGSVARGRSAAQGAVAAVPAAAPPRGT